jgi:hypothetical protein
MARRSRPFRQSTTFRILVVLFVVGFVLLLALPGAGFVTLPSATPFAGGGGPPAQGGGGGRPGRVAETRLEVGW